MPNGRCRIHGGKSPAGEASPQFQTGRYSRVLPRRLLARYDEAQHDSRLLELHDEISLLDARLADVLGRVEQGDSRDLWKALREALADYHAGNDNAIRTIGGLIERGIADWAAWGEVSKLIGQRASLVESERRRLVEMQQMVTAEQASTLIVRMAAIVRRYVTDRDSLAAISAELAGLLDRPALPAPRA